MFNTGITESVSICRVYENITAVTVSLSSFRRIQEQRRESMRSAVKRGLDRWKERQEGRGNKKEEK